MIPRKRWVPLAREPDPSSSAEVWENDEYSVLVLYQEPQLRGDGTMQLTIARHDHEPARDWRHLQSIKNEIAGPEREAIELFPAESRLVDWVNFTHLWVWPERQPVDVGEDSGRSVGCDKLQRPWQPGLSTEPPE